MAGYFGYFGAAGGRRPGYYSFDLGDWHAMRSTARSTLPADSRRRVWLRAIWPPIREVHDRRSATSRFSRRDRTEQDAVRALWEILYENNVDVIVNGHDHLYERFTPQDPDGFPDPTRGIREFIVGTGGALSTARQERRTASGESGSRAC